MAREYKALSVPIALLHQKVYPTSRRLAKMVPLKKPDNQLARIQQTFGTRVISPSAVARAPEWDLFERLPYLRRFVFLLGDRVTAVCRVCHDRLLTDQAIRDHQGSCSTIAMVVYNRLLQARKCAICEREIPNPALTAEFDRLPVCSKACMETWEIMSPLAYRKMVELDDIKKMRERFK